LFPHHPRLRGDKLFAKTGKTTFRNDARRRSIVPGRRAAAVILRQRHDDEKTSLRDQSCARLAPTTPKLS
jgi:hypothetical protein